MGKLSSLTIMPLGGGMKMPTKGGKMSGKGPEIDIEAGAPDDDAGEDYNEVEGAWDDFAKSAGIVEGKETCEKFRALFDLLFLQADEKEDKEEAAEDESKEAMA